MNIVLTGFKGSGKSVVGKLLSEILDKDFFDIDVVIQELFFKKYSKKKNIFEIYDFLKEEKFRSLENIAFFTLKDVKNAIIATAGGSVLKKQNIELLKRSKTVVFLQTCIEEIKRRINSNKNQDSIFQDESLLLKTFEKRKVLYEKSADITVSSDNKTIYEIAFEIKDKIKYLYV